LRHLSFGALTGWAQDDHAEAIEAYAVSHATLGPGWPAPDGGDARAFFENNFVPVAPTAGEALITGYYEPVLAGSLSFAEGFSAALYGLPPDLAPDAPWLTRSEIETGGHLIGRELVWVADAVEAFLAQVQGSVRVRLADGQLIRLGFAGKNGHAYRSIGAELVARGAIPAQAVSAKAIRDWCQASPDGVADLLRTNPSFVFFQALDLPPDTGPLGAMGVPVTTLRSIAVDPACIPLGVPVWLETEAGAGLRRLMIAQDMGSAIKGPQRADVFCGTGDVAGRMAGDMKGAGRLTALMPRGMVQGALR
jgi:membrane-bound lytic murein transglycosylase A